MSLRTTVLRNAALVGLLATLLAACDRDATTPVAKKKAAPIVQAAPAADAAQAAVAAATEGMVAGVTAGKSRARVSTFFDLPAEPVPGKAFKVNVAVVPGIAAPAMSIDISATDGLTVIAPVTTQRIEQVQSDTVTNLEVTAQAARPGIQLVNVTVSLEEPAGLATQHFSFPVLVGGVAIAPPPPAVKPAKDKKPVQKPKAG